MHATTPALDDAAQRVSRYLARQSLTNAGAGLSIGLGLSPQELLTSTAAKED